MITAIVIYAVLVLGAVLAALAVLAETAGAFFNVLNVLITVKKIAGA